jgi:hypothetical protein
MHKIALTLPGLVVLSTLAFSGWLLPEVESAQGKPDVTIETITKAWQARQERIRSGRFRWTDRITHPKGVFSDFWKKSPRTAGEVSGTIPPEDTTFSSTCVLTFDGQKMRYSTDGARWSKKTKKYEPISELAVFNGDVSKDLDTTGPNHERYWPQGIIRREKRNIFASEPVLQPVLMTCRGMTPGMRAYDLETFDLTGRKVSIDRHLCWELRRQPTSNREDLLYVDSGRGFIFVRFLSTTRDIVTRKIDVRYEVTPQKEWLPKEWTVIQNTSDGKLDQSHQVRLTGYEINPIVGSEEFELEFPPGTRVHDARNISDWIVKPDGSGNRTILRSDFGATYERMLATEPGYALREQPFLSRFNWPAIASIIVACGCLLLFLWRRLKMRRKP